MASGPGPLLSFGEVTLECLHVVGVGVGRGGMSHLKSVSPSESEELELVALQNCILTAALLSGALTAS